MKHKFSDFLNLLNKKNHDNIENVYSVTNKGLFPRNNKFSEKLSKDYTDNKIIEYGNLIFGNSRHILNFGVYKLKTKGTVSSAYKVFEVDTNLINPIYLEIYLNYNRNNFLHIIKPGSRDNLPIDVNLLYHSEIDVPSMAIQNQIVKINNIIQKTIHDIKELDKKIEELAQALYKRWFVDFDFPNQNGDPYQSSGGEMVESELGLIPKGWEILNLDSRIKFDRGIEPGSKNYQIKKTDTNVQFFRVGDLSNKGQVFVESNLIKNRIVEENDVLVSFDGAIGRVGAGFSGSYSTGLRKVYDSKNEISNSSIYYMMKSKLIQETIKKHANGTTILHAGSSIPFLKIPFKINIFKLYQEKIDPIFNKLLKIKLENQKLSELRDKLLPKLMSGEIEVPIERVS